MLLSRSNILMRLWALIVSVKHWNLWWLLSSGGWALIYNNKVVLIDVIVDIVFILVLKCQHAL